MKTAHPRSRGEHPTISDSSRSAVGSSPLARGTFGGNLLIAFLVRLIPARAGNIAFSTYEVLRY